MYFDKELHRGYNAYIDAAKDDLGTQMDVGVLVLEAGDTYAIHDAQKETSVLLLEGAVELSYGDKTVLAERPDCFRHEAYCLLAPRGTKIGLSAKTHAELYIQQTPNERDYEAVLYTPETVQVQHAGANGELMGAMRREIKTFFDYDNAPFSNMVLVVNVDQNLPLSRNCCHICHSCIVLYLSFCSCFCRKVIPTRNNQQEKSKNKKIILTTHQTAVQIF